MRTCLTSVLFALSAFAGPVAAGAADLAAAPPSPAPVAETPGDGWHFEVTPYVWMTGMSGNVSPFRRAPTVHIDSSFSDILEELNLAGFANAWGTNGRFGFYADLMYVDTSESEASGPVTIPAYGITVPGIDVSVDSTIFTGALFGAVRLADTDDFRLDALGGIRFERLTTEVSAVIPSVPLGYSAKSDFGWIDPALGFRMAYDFGDRVSLVGQADVGGFSVGSDLTWQAMATVNYQITRATALSFGYRYMSIDYDDDGHVFDTVLQGPTLGLSFRF
ncbi:porin family protein [Martelella soudanensis]|uniref:YfaZ family outer membrane protein n=1 Tax=unclassified Martelella TaxID=2629616 RepID=UPI0015DDE3E1|nr:MULTISPECIES: YfaZ family outer membrane protein [unclassified Martelella]